MSAETTTFADPQWTLGDRLRKARETAGMDRLELAARLGISRNTVINYETGRTHPTRARLHLWALATGVREEWLAVTHGYRPTAGDVGPPLYVLAA